MKHWLVMAWLMLVLPLAAAAADWQEQPQWQKTFADAGVHGTLLVFDESSQRWLVADAARARRPYSPASTFKLFNALVALDTGAVSDEYAVVRWDGKVRDIDGEPYAMWNRDQTLASAMRYSAVWFYQDMARRAGRENMQRWLDRANYGNHTIGGAIDEFWLNDTLRISAEQQVDFLRQLADGTLPFSARAQEAVRRISIIEAQPHYILHAKTGLEPGAAQNAKPGGLSDGIGWYVGWVEYQGKRWFFAMNMDVGERSGVKAGTSTDLRAALTKQMLRQIGALPMN